MRTLLLRSAFRRQSPSPQWWRKEKKYPNTLSIIIFITMVHQDSLEGRLFKYYDTLHTQSQSYVTDDIIEALKNYGERWQVIIVSWLSANRRADTVEAYMTGIMDANTALDRLAFHKPKTQLHTMSDTYMLNDVNAELREYQGWTTQAIDHLQAKTLHLWYGTLMIPLYSEIFEIYSRCHRRWHVERTKKQHLVVHSPSRPFGGVCPLPLSKS